MGDRFFAYSDWAGDPEIGIRGCGTRGLPKEQFELRSPCVCSAAGIADSQR